MDWLAENWFFVLLFIAFIAMHLFGHGHGGHSHGGHGAHDSIPPPPSDEPTRHRH
jgi:hypothetical protein